MVNKQQGPPAVLKTFFWPIFWQKKYIFAFPPDGLYIFEYNNYGAIWKGQSKKVIFFVK